MPTQFECTISELELAYKRAKDDRPGRCFIEYPYLIAWAEIDLSSWLAELKEKIATGFQPHSSRLCWIPKPHSLLRPGNIINLKDEVVYNLIIGRLYRKIWDVLKTYQSNPDSAYILNDVGNREWIKGSFQAWDKFRKLSLEYLNTGSQYVVVSDIIGFYENIDIDKLLSDLRQIAGGTCPEIDLLRLCLRKWSARGDKGIPQGYSASDILAKVYANSIDVTLKNEGYRHLRYVDDIRIFCKTRLEAKQAIFVLSQLVHKKGLNLQSAKTKILSKTDAMSKIEGVKPILEGIRNDLMTEILEEIEDEGPYSDSRNVSLLLRVRRELPQEVLERAFKEYFYTTNAFPFDTTLFHYLLNRLAEANSKIAIRYCLNALYEKPEETDSILSYFSKVKLSDEQLSVLVNYVTSNEAIYDYQCYKILKWLYTENLSNEEVIKFCRNVCRNRNRDIWMRSYATAYLSKFGNYADIESFQATFANCTDDLERADFVMAMSKLEIGRRNTFFATIAGDSHLIDRAIKLAKAS